MDKVFSNPDVYCVRVPFVNLGSGESNCYIVRDGGDCLVVDPGAANEVGMRRVRNALFELGVALGECKVFLTHTHFDHAEAARVLFPEGTCVYVSEVGFEERRPIRAEAARELFVRRMLKMGATLADAEEYSRNDYEPTFLPAGALDYRSVREGDEVHVGRFVFDVVEVPGHTLDLVCLVGRDGAPSFTGDEVIFGTTPSVDAPFDGEDALALYMEGLGLSGDGPQRLALWRSDGKRVFGASGMQSERLVRSASSVRAGGSCMARVARGCWSPMSCSLAGSMRACRWPMGLSVPVCMSVTIRSRMALMENGSSTCTGRFPDMARDSADKRCVRARPISCRASCAIATAWSRPHASAPALVGKSWRGVRSRRKMRPPGVRRLRFRDITLCSKRSLACAIWKTNKLRREEVDGTWRFYAC